MTEHTDMSVMSIMETRAIFSILCTEICKIEAFLNSVHWSKQIREADLSVVKGSAV